MGMTEEIDYTLLPAHLRKGVREYIERGHLPGDFLCSVISNDLMKAYGHGDQISKDSLGDILSFFWNEAPGRSHGSPEIMKTWASNGGLEGRDRSTLTRPLEGP